MHLREPDRPRPEWLLGAALLYHALNGLRIIIIDFWPRDDPLPPPAVVRCWVLFVIIGIPVAVQIMAPAFGLQPPFTFGGS